MNALEGIRLLELTHMVSGPYAGMILADLGAETIKVEPPGQGEMTRLIMADEPGYAVQGMGPYFMSLNRNKKSVSLNLKLPAGLALFYELVGMADVVLNNYRAGVMRRLKIDHEHLAEVNPGIITCSITGFGETGPDRDRPAYDMVAQAMSGVMSVTGQTDAAPMRAGIPIADVSGSMMGVTGILAALVARGRTGRGQHVDISMLDAQISAMNYMATIALISGQAPERMGSAHRSHVPYDVYPCKDGYLILAVVTDPFWRSLTELLPLDELDTPENRSRRGRIKNRSQIDRVLGQLFQTGSRKYWLEKLQSARIPCAPVNDFCEAFEEPQVRAREMVVEVEFPQGSRVRMPGNAVKLSETYAGTFTPSPLVGQHNQEIFGRLLGKSEPELEELRSRGVI